MFTILSETDIIVEKLGEDCAVENRYYIGADVGGTKTAYGLFAQDQTLLKTYKDPSDKTLSAEAFSDNMVERIKRILQENDIPLRSLGGLGVGMPSYLCFEEGIVVRTPNLPNFVNFPLRDYLHKRLGVPVALDNDGNAAALAEFRLGAGRGFPHMVYCAVSTGLGTGIIIDGRLFHGSYGLAGEAGHMIANIEEGGLSCQCGNHGCFESHISGSKIVRHVAEKIARGEPTLMLELCGGNPENLTAIHIEQAYDAKDPMAAWALEHMARYLGTWAYNIYIFLNINCFVFGGGLTRFKALFQRARAVFDGLNKNDLPVHFLFAEMTSDMGIVGAKEVLMAHLEK